MRYAKILRINEFNQLQDIVNHCHLYVVESSGIRLNTNREKIYESGSAIQPESSILVIPNTIADTTENVQKITKTIVDYLGEGAVGGSTADSIVANHVIIGRPGLYAKEETRSKGLKI